MFCDAAFKLTCTINDLSVHPDLLTKLKSANLYSFKDILQFSQPELQKIAKLSAYEVKIITEAVSHILLQSEVVTAFALITKPHLSSRKKLIFGFLGTRNENFDGIYTGTISEICGESGCGKTQLCLQLCISAQLPHHLGGLSSKVIYLHSEGDFPIKRFIQMTEAFKKQHGNCGNMNLTDNLILKKVHYLKEAMHVLQHSVMELLQQEISPKLLIIDSVAALLRCEYDSQASRMSIIQQFATEIWKLANIYGMTIICVNQVSGHGHTDSTRITSDIPSLGLLWSNILTTRIKLSRKLSESGSTLRVFQIIFSSYNPQIAFDFKISKHGIEPV